MRQGPAEDDGVFFARQAAALLARLHLDGTHTAVGYRWRLSADVLGALRSLGAGFVPTTGSIDGDDRGPARRALFGYPFDVDAGAPERTIAMRSPLGEEVFWADR